MPNEKNDEDKLNLLTKLFSIKFSAGTWIRDHYPVLVLFAAVSVVSIGVLGQFLFGKKLLLFSDIGSDTYYSYYAFYYFFTDYLANFQLPLWSFKLGAGSNVLTLYQFLYDPFSIVYFLGGVENISRLIVWVFVLKTFCAAAFTYLYMRYIGLGVYARVTASILFAFNGFLMVWGQHYFFASWVVFLPLLLYTVEIWLKTSRWLPMVLCIALMVLNIAIFFQVMVFCGLYLVFRMALEKEKYACRAWVINLVKFGAIIALGLSISAVLWLPEYYLLKSSPRISASFMQALKEIISNFASLNTPEYYRSLLSRIFSSNLQGVGSEYTGFLNYYESIQLYVGILPLLLLPQLYSVFSSRAKWVGSLALLAIVVFLVSPGFSQIMNGFQYPSYRWGYNVVMFELLLAAFVFDAMLKQNKINLSILMMTGFLLFVCAVYLNLNGHYSDLAAYRYSTLKTFEIIVLIACYSIVLYYLIKARNKRLAFSLILVLLCAELIAEHQDTFNKRSVFDKGIEHNLNVNFFDYGNQAVQQISKADQTVYRVEKNHWILSLNDSLIQNYFGLDSYNSLNTPSYIKFVQEFGQSGKLTVVKWNSLDHPYLADILSVKYHLTKTTDKLTANVAFKGKYGDVSVYERNKYLPFGFTYESYISPLLFGRLNIADKERVLLQGAVLEENAPKRLNELQKIASVQEDDAFRANLRKDVLNVIEMGEDKIIGNIQLEHGKLLFLSIPFDIGWTAYINGQKAELYRVNIGFSGLYLDKGDSTVELRYTPPYMKAGAVISVLGLLVVIALQLRSRKQSQKNRSERII